MQKTVYKLIHKEEAIEGKNHGLLLSYNVVKFPVIPITVGNFNMHIPLLWKRSNIKKITFFRPFKLSWDTHRKRLSREYWGKKNSPLTNLWLIMKVKTIDKNSIELAEKRLYDHDVIRNLKIKSNKFYIIKNKQHGKEKINC